MSSKKRLVPCDVREATHVKSGGRVERIASKRGVSDYGRLARPSEGGFSVTTSGGGTVSMWDAQAYFKEET